MPKRHLLAYLLLGAFAYGPWQALCADALQQALPDDCHHSGRYQQAKTVAGLSKPLVSHGSYVFNCDSGLIWHTQMPIVETIVYKAGGDAIHIGEHGETTTQDGRVQQALGGILNKVIGGDREYIEQNFEISASEAGLSLRPKQRRLRKFLQSIELQTGQDEAQMTLVHAKGELTQIRIYNRKVHKMLDAQSCTAVGTIPPKSCALLAE